jgi:Helix-turn-helix of DDE superfamily endonuclease
MVDAHRISARIHGLMRIVPRAGCPGYEASCVPRDVSLIPRVAHRATRKRHAGTKRAIRSSCVGVYASMGPCGPHPSCLHRAVPATPLRPHRRTRRPVDRRPPGHLHRRRGHARQRAAGAGPRHRLAFADRVLATLVVLRLQLSHQALAVPYGVDRATITRAVGESRPLLAGRGFAVPGLPGLRLRTLADVFAYAAAHGVELRIDATETQVRRPRATDPAAARSCRANASRTRSRPPRSPTVAAAPCGPARSGRAACTTRPRSRPTASGTCSSSTRPSPRRSTPAIGGWPRPSGENATEDMPVGSAGTGLYVRPSTKLGGVGNGREGRALRRAAWRRSAELAGLPVDVRVEVERPDSSRPRH